MAIGVVSDTDFASELEKLNSSTDARLSDPSDSAQIIEKPSKGRSDGDVNIPDSLRQIIGEEALLNGRSAALHLAGGFGISPSSVSAYTKGATSTTTYNNPSPSILGHINKSRARAVKRASKTLNQALGSITQDKLDYAEAKDLSAIAKDMSVIIKNLEPQSPVVNGEGTKQQNFVIYAPQFRKEESFEVINVVE